MTSTSVRESRAEDDEKCFGPTTGWFIHASNERNVEVTSILKIGSAYCVGVHPVSGEEPAFLFVQPSRHLSTRNEKVEYVVVEKPELIKQVLGVLGRKYDADEVVRARNQDIVQMNLAKEGVL